MKVLGLSGLLLLPLLAFLLPSHLIGNMRNEENIDPSPEAYVLEIEAVPETSNYDVQEEPTGVISPGECCIKPEPVETGEPLDVLELEEPVTEDVDNLAGVNAKLVSDEGESIGVAKTPLERAKPIVILRLKPKELERANAEDLERAKHQEPDRANPDGSNGSDTEVSDVEPPDSCVKNSDGL